MRRELMAMIDHGGWAVGTDDAKGLFQKGMISNMKAGRGLRGIGAGPRFSLSLH